MSIQKPVNALLAYESAVQRSRLVELEIFTDEEPDEEGSVWARTASGARIKISRDRRVWWITDRKEGWKRDRECRFERICGYQARMLPLPEIGKLTHLVKGYWLREGNTQNETAN